MELRYPEGLPFRPRRAARPGRHARRADAQGRGDRPQRDVPQPDRRRDRRCSGLASGRGGGPAAPRAPPGTLPLRFDVQINAPSSLRDRHQPAAHGGERRPSPARRPRPAGALRARGGGARRGDLRGQALPGDAAGRIDFTNPTKIEPFFDIDAETRVRAPGQTYIVDIRLTGTLAHLQPPQFNSDPPLPPLEIMTLLFGDASRATQDAELRAVQSAGEDQRQLATSRVEQARRRARPSTPSPRAVERAAGLEIVPDHAEPLRSVSAAHADRAPDRRQADLRQGLHHVLAEHQHRRATTSSSSSSTTRAPSCPGCCRATRTAPTRSTCA